MAHRVIRPVGVELAGPELAVAADRRDAVDELGELGDVVAVGGGQRDRQRDAFASTIT